MEKKKRNTEKMGIHKGFIGTSSVAGRQRNVCIPDKLRFRHVHVIGRPLTGKTTLLMHMIINDIKNGHGVGIIDPHGDLVEGLLHLMPKEAIDRVVYFNPGDPDWIPLWNPMQDIEGLDKCRITDDLVGVLRSVIVGWGNNRGKSYLLAIGQLEIIQKSGTK